MWRTTSLNLQYSSSLPTVVRTFMSATIEGWQDVHTNMQRSSTCDVTRTRAPLPVLITPTTPAQSPLQTPAQSPLRTPAQAPLLVQTPNQAPLLIGTPAQAPLRTPLQIRSPTQAPVQMPVPTPTRRRGFCFSSHNRVEVQGIGSVIFDQLRIGDYVKSGDGTFTQVYSVITILIMKQHSYKYLFMLISVLRIVTMLMILIILMKHCYYYHLRLR